MAKSKKKISDCYVVITDIDPTDGAKWEGERLEVDIYSLSDPSKIDLEGYTDSDDVYIYKLVPIYKVERKMSLVEISVD